MVTVRSHWVLRFVIAAARRHPGRVFALILGMMICLALALAVVGLVAVPARRDGREVLTHRGEELVGAVRERRHRS